MPRGHAAALAALLAAAACSPAPPPSHDRDLLERAMQSCLAELEPRPPCIEVDRARGFVVIKDDDPAKPDSYLIVPTAPVTGIEDARALRPPVLDFWTWGWDAARRLLGRPPEDMALAINSRAGRSQDLLHIHISCVEPAVRDALARAPIGPHWAPAPFFEFRGDRYNIRKVAALEPSPLLLLLDLPGAGDDMAAQSLGAIGSADGGFYLVTDSTAPGVVAEAEALLDQDCR